MGDEGDPDIDIGDDIGDDDDGGLGRVGRALVFKKGRERRQNRRDARQQQSPSQPPSYQQPPQQEIIYQQPQQEVIHLQPGAQAMPTPPQQIVVQPQPGQVIMEQPVAFTQGMWSAGMTEWWCLYCYASCCVCCARGEVSELMGGSWFGACMMRLFLPCISCCTLMSERNAIRTRFNIPATDGCCAAWFCEMCIVAQHLHQLRGFNKQ